MKTLSHRTSVSIPLQLIAQRTVAASSSFLLFISMIVDLLIYYLSLYFQIVRGTIASESGIRNILFLVTMLLTPFGSGTLTSAIGYYVICMWLGAALVTVGPGLLIILLVDSPNDILSGYKFIVGLGLEMCTQIPFNAVYYILPKEQPVIGSALVSFYNSLGPILGTNNGQAIFANASVKRLKLVQGVDAAAVIMAGPTNLATAGGLPVLREAFNDALLRAFILAIVSAKLCFCCSVGIE